MHSGEELAAKVDLTRARVSQVLKEAEAAGVALERVKGSGSPLVEAPEFPRSQGGHGAACGVGHGARAGPPVTIEVVDQIDSTSTELMRRAATPRHSRRAVAAEWQTAGRGRRGRTWTGDRRRQPHVFARLALRAGRRLSGRTLAGRRRRRRPGAGSGRLHRRRLKWPNDLIHRHLKFGGILVELNGDALGPSTDGHRRRPQRADAGGRTQDIAQPVSDLTAVAGRSARRSTAIGCWRASWPSSPPCSSAYAKHGFAPFAVEWQRRHAYQGKPVRSCCPMAPAVSRARSRRGRERRARARRRTAPRALPLRRNLAAARLGACRRCDQLPFRAGLTACA